MTPPSTVADVLTDKPHHARQDVAGEPGVLLNHPLLHQLRAWEARTAQQMRGDREAEA